jgi:exonuclease III
MLVGWNNGYYSPLFIYLAREMRRYKIEILAIQETRWSGKGKIDKTNYTLYYAGEKKQGKNGTAFLVGGGIRNKIM